jgi:probable HAF family extracellular repeat protein
LTLGGPNSAASGPNDRDEVPIISDTSRGDPLGEDFCGFQSHFICLGGVWKKGVLTALPTLGGNNAQTVIGNDRGQIIGFAENKKRDPDCASAQPSQVLQFEAVLWDPSNKIHELRPYRRDTVGFAIGINDRGDVVGGSGTCKNAVLFPLARGPHALLWHDGVPIQLGTLGGTQYSTASSINNRGGSYRWVEPARQQALSHFPLDPGARDEGPWHRQRRSLQCSWRAACDQ